MKRLVIKLLGYVITLPLIVTPIVGVASDQDNIETFLLAILVQVAKGCIVERSADPQNSTLLYLLPPGWVALDSRECLKERLLMRQG